MKTPHPDPLPSDGERESSPETFEPGRRPTGATILIEGGELGGFLFPLGIEFGKAVLDVD
jgi:hypothetical protein